MATTEQRKKHTEIITALETLATKHEYFSVFCASRENETLLHEYLKLMHECQGAHYNRSRSFEKWQLWEAVAFDMSHHDIMKAFVINGEEVMAYSFREESPLEEASTKDLLAYENNCKLEEIEIRFRQK